MNAEKRIELVTGMIKAYDEALGNDLLNAILEKPAEFKKCIFPFYGYAAELIQDAREELSKKQSGTGYTSALKRYYKRTLDGCNGNLKGYTTDGGKYYICDGYSVAELSGKPEAIPEAKSGPDWANSLKKFLDFPKDLKRIEPSTLAEIKAKKAENTALYGKGKYNLHPVQIAENVFVNPDFYIDIVSIMQTCTAFIDPYAKVTPVYFIAEDGRKAMLLQNRNYV